MIFYFYKYAYKLRGNIYDWFKSYLKIVSNMFFNNNTLSYIGNITHGVYQWSILCPLLFILYINDFPRASNLLFSILYADDTNIFIGGTEYHKVISTLNTELLKVSDCLNSNKLTIHLKKTHYMVFHLSRIKTPDSESILNGTINAN